MENIKNFFVNIWTKVKNFCQPVIEKIVKWVKTIKWKIVWDKITTGLLILLILSPLLVLLYLIHDLTLRVSINPFHAWFIRPTMKVVVIPS